MTYIMSELEYDVACMAHGELNATLNMLEKAQAPLEVYHYVLFDNDTDLIMKEDKDYYFAPTSPEHPDKYIMGGPDSQNRPTAYTERSPLSRRGQREAYQMARRGGAEPTRHSFGSPVYNVGGMEVKPGMAQRAKDIMAKIPELPGMAHRGLQGYKGTKVANVTADRQRQIDAEEAKIMNLPDNHPTKVAYIQRMTQRGHGSRFESPTEKTVEETETGADLTSGAPLIGTQPSFEAPTGDVETPTGDVETPTAPTPAEPESRSQERRNQPLETPSLQTGPEPQPTPETPAAAAAPTPEPETEGEEVKEVAQEADSPQDFVQILSQTHPEVYKNLFSPDESGDPTRSTGQTMTRARKVAEELMQHVQSPEFDKNRTMKEVMDYLREQGSKSAYTQMGRLTPDRRAAFNQILGIEGPPAVETPAVETPAVETPAVETEAPAPVDDGFQFTLPPKDGVKEETPSPPKAGSGKLSFELPKSFDNPIDLAWDALAFRKNHQ